MNEVKDKELYELAKKRVFAKKSFTMHLNIYLIVSLLLFAISVYNKSNWFIFPVVGWGIGVIAHKISLNTFLSSKSDIEEEFALLKRTENKNT